MVPFYLPENTRKKKVKREHWAGLSKQNLISNSFTDSSCSPASSFKRNFVSRVVFFFSSISRERYVAGQFFDITELGTKKRNAKFTTNKCQ